MTRTLEATYEGTLLHLSDTLDLEPNTVVRVTVETIGEQAPADVIAVCLAANLAGPPDWSENLEEYLYGNKPFPAE